MLERGLNIDHTMIYRWVQRYAPELEKRCRSHLKAANDSWRVDETYVKVKKVWVYLYRAVDSRETPWNFTLRGRGCHWSHRLNSLFACVNCLSFTFLLLSQSLHRLNGVFSAHGPIRP